jgi:hypothetical protein
MRFIDRALLIASIDALHEGASDHPWSELGNAAMALAEALGWDIDESNGEPPDGHWLRTRLDEVLK